MTKKSISERLIDAAEEYMQECLEESIFNGRIKARTVLEQLAQEIEDSHNKLELVNAFYLEGMEKTEQRESLWRELDKAYQIPEYVFAWDAISKYKKYERIKELRKELGLDE